MTLPRKWFVAEIHAPYTPIKWFFNYEDATAFAELMNDKSIPTEKYIVAYASGIRAS